MSRVTLTAIMVGVALACSTSSEAAPVSNYPYTWSVVVNNGDYMPTDACNPATPDPLSCRHFNSYNQPSVNARGLVALRARSRGGQGLGEPVQGVYLRDMQVLGPILRLFDRATPVPQPNNRDTLFREPPAFPRIDISSDTVVSRGNHAPVWQVVDANGNTVEQVGTAGIYTNPFGILITGASKLGSVPDFSFFQVPEYPNTPFDVFPGAPAVTDGKTLVFKGNYTVDGISKTGVYYRDVVNAPIPLASGASLAPAGGTRPVILIANNTETDIPGTTTVFGSLAPPSAADRRAVFAGFDNEENPTLGGIYLARLNGPQPPLTTLVRIGQQVPGEDREARFNKLGESLSFDGRFVGFWGAWGTQTKTLVLQCPSEGNAQRVAYCRAQYPNGFAVQVPLHQGIFVHDIRTRQTYAVAKAPDDFDDFLYWNFSGEVPGSSESGDGEPARWRASAFVAVSGGAIALADTGFRAAFKARKGTVSGGTYMNPIDGIYLKRGPGRRAISTLVTTGMDGTLIDPQAVDSTTGASLPVTDMGIERDAFRGNILAINAVMGSEETGWAGIYLTHIGRDQGHPGRVEP